MSLSTISNNNDIKTATPEGAAFRVDVTNQPIGVEFDEAGEPLNFYNEAQAVAEAASATVLTYTVPALKLLRLQRVDVSGHNKALYSVRVNGSDISKKRTYYTHLNEEFTFQNINLVAGDILTIVVENGSQGASDFNANIQGNLRDA